MIAQPTLASLVAGRLEQASPAAPLISQSGQALCASDCLPAIASLATTLRTLGLPPGTPIAVMSKDPVQFVFAAVAIMAEQCLFVPLDGMQAEGRLAAMVQAGKLGHAFCDAELADLAARRLGLVNLPFNGAAASDSEACGQLITRLKAASARPFYLYFTSGTAGDPKPVLGRSDSLLHFLQWELATFGLDQRSRIAQLTPPWHDPFLRDLLVPILSGGTLCIPPSRSLAVAPLDLARWLHDEAVTLIHCTPTVFRNLAQARIEPHLLARLEQILIAGEALRGSHVAAWFAHQGHRVKLFNLYGPTETTLAKLFHPIGSADAEAAIVPIGSPLPDTSVSILTDTGKPAAVGEPGELVIETRYPSLGYLNRPAATQAVFSPDPALAPDQAIAYRTGDLAVRRRDGTIVFIDRLDRRSKFRGQQIDLGWIEDEILQRSEISSCVAGVLQTADQPDRLALWYVAPLVIDARDLRQELGSVLPRSAVPDLWVRVDSLPLNHNAKLDHDALVRLAIDADAATQSPYLVGYQVADRLALIWSELLDMAEPDRDASFVDLGGDSLAIMLLIARLENDFDYCLSLWDVFDDLTVTKLAAMIEAASQDPAAPPT